jgi:hypothetical protein
MFTRRCTASLLELVLLSSVTTLAQQQLSPFTNTSSLKLTVDVNRTYVLGWDPLLIHVSLTNSDAAHPELLLWRANAPQRVLTGLTYKVVSPDGQTHLLQTCRGGNDSSNTTSGSYPGHPYEEEIDLGAIHDCLRFQFDAPGHYSIQADFERPVCTMPSDNGCRIDMDLGQWFQLKMSSNAVSFDVLPPYGPSNPAPSEAMSAADGDSHIHEWLDSGDPRLAAWAAYFVRRDHPMGGVDGLRRWLIALIDHDQLPAASWEIKPLAKERSEAAHAVLDALIQARVELPITAIQKITANDAVLGLILAMQPKWNEGAVLDVFDHLGGFKNDEPSDFVGSYARNIAGDALAARDSSGFLDRMKADFVLHLMFSVMPVPPPGAIRSYDGPIDDGPIKVCGNGGIEKGEPMPTWPPIGSYGLTDGSPVKSFYDGGGLYHPITADSNIISSLGEEKLGYTRIVSQRYGAAAFVDPCGVGDDRFPWVEHLARHGENFQTQSIFYVTSEDDYHTQLQKWLSDQGAVYAQLLSDAGTKLVPLKVSISAVDFVHPAPRSNASNPPLPRFSGFPPAALTITSWNGQSQ